ncbi:MAG: TonB-dependent receptor plug domain-containing protein, partial [Bacteroidia bacterium]|nr:TonB-dependent receptor plug domain-containing protein [Bacteroidia bacterium]
QYYSEPGAARVLKEVIITAPKLEEKREFSRYGTPDYSISTDVLENANSMNLMYAIQGRVPGLRLILINGSYYVLLGGASSFGSGAVGMEPLLVIDGLPYNGGGGMGGDGIIAMIDQLNPTNILRIDVFKYGSSAAFGARGANGVIAIYTKNGVPLKEEVSGYDKSLFQLVTIGGYTTPRKFRSTDYSTTVDSGEHDYRSTIYWNPNVNTSAQTGEAIVSFYAADLETKYRIVVEGVTSLGEPIHAEYFIKIVK